MSETEQDPLERVGDGVSLAGVWKENIRRYVTTGGFSHGYMGHWSFFKAASAEKEDMERTIRCARTYSVELDSDGNTEALVWKNLHEDKPGLERATQRSQDGHWECSFRRDAHDPYFSGFMAMAEVEREQGLPSCLFWRSILLSPMGMNSCRLPLSLPPDPVDELTDPGSQFTNWNPHVMSSTVWAYENFLQDGPFRWSAGPLYSMHTLRLVTHFFIRERQKDIDTRKAISGDDWNLPQLRPRLPEDESRWMDGGTWKGVMHEMIWDEDGEILALRPRPAAWHPPPPRPDYRLFRYEDGFYAHYPLRISPADPSATSTFGNGIRFEFGGMMRSKREFRRVILRYSVCGSAESIVVERYHAQEVSHFDGKVRKSMDLRGNSRRSFQTQRPGEGLEQGPASGQRGSLGASPASSGLASIDEKKASGRSG